MNYWLLSIGSAMIVGSLLRYGDALRTTPKEKRTKLFFLWWLLGGFIGLFTGSVGMGPVWGGFPFIVGTFLLLAGFGVFGR